MERKHGTPYILHHPDSFFRLVHELILRGFDLCARFLAQLALVIWIHASALELALLGRLGAVEEKSRILHRFSRFGCELDVCVQRCRPAGEKAGLDLLVLSEPDLPDLLFCQCIFLEAARERILAGLGGVRLCQELGTGERGSGNSVVKGLWLGLCAGRRREGGLGLGRRRCVGEKRDFVGDGT